MRLLSVRFRACIGCLLALCLLLPLPVAADEIDHVSRQPWLPARYARIWQNPVSVFAAPGDPARMTPIEELLPPDSWVSIEEEIEVNGQRWYRIDDGAYVLASELVTSPASAFAGVSLEEVPDHPLGFVVAQQLNVRSRPNAIDGNRPLRTVQRYETVDILGSEEVDGQIWHRIGDDEYVHGNYVRVVYPVARPDKVDADQRWVAVDLAQQTLAAYEGDRLVFATLVASGRPPWYTPKGLFRVWVKLVTGDMEGGIVERGDYYYLQDVPWIMYFSRDVGLHATYWHDRFGYPSSHGCVNLSPLDAQWLFEWTSPLFPNPDYPVAYASRTNPGTWVYVYNSS